MKLNTLTNLILATVATAGMSTAAFADNSASFDAQLTVDSVNNCHITVTAENGTAMAATYKYTANDQAAGTFGTTTLDTKEPLTVLVSSVGPGGNCPLGDFAVATSNPGIKIAKNTAGIPTHGGGVWPVRWGYTQFDAYDDAAGTDPSPGVTGVSTPPSTGNDTYGSKYFTTNASNTWFTPAQQLFITGTSPDQHFGTYEGGRIPALLSHAGKLAVGGTTDVIFPLTGTGLMPVVLHDEDPVHDSDMYTIYPPETAASVRIGLAQLLATVPYALTTSAPDPLTVYDTVNGGGVPLTGTGTMTITPL